MVALAALFISPLLLTLLRFEAGQSAGGVWLDRCWLGEAHVAGVTLPEAPIPSTLRSIVNGTLQKQEASKFDRSFAGREALLRCSNEMWFRVFHDVANRASKVVIGKNDVLFEREYIEEYFVRRTTKVGLQPWVKDAKRLQELCHSRGMAFAIVIAPSKASIYPEDMPPRWLPSFDARPRSRALLTELLHENSIAYVDAGELVLREKLKGPAAPLFSKGGTHWNRRAALAVANGVQAELSAQGKIATSIEVASCFVTDEPETDDEEDLVRLMNGVWKWRYPCERISVQPSNAPNAEHLTMAIIGDSFGWPLLELLHESHQYSDIGFYFYYTQFKTRNTRYTLVRKPTGSIDFDREIFAADCLLLEINEASGLFSEHYLSAFIRDALANRPEATGSKTAFRAD